jgi:hypothetical protein
LCCVICLTTSCVSHRRLSEVHGPSSASAADEHSASVGRVDGQVQRSAVWRGLLYCSRGSSSGHRLYGCTVVRLCCCTVVRLYVCSIVQFCTVVPTPHTVGSTHGCTHRSMHGLHAGTVAQKWLYGFVYTQPTHPHSERRFFIFFVIPRSSRYFLPTDPRGYRTPTF